MHVAAVAAFLALTSINPATAQLRELPAACRDKPVPTKVDGLAYAIDGDTLAIDGQPHIRVWGIQAPELRDKHTGQETVAGMRSRAHLEDLLKPSRQAVSCTPTKWDRYCRLVATCDTKYPSGQPNGVAEDLGWQMIDAGQAYGYYLDETLQRAPDTSRAYAAAESLARAQRRGLWTGWLGDR